MRIFGRIVGVLAACMVLLVLVVVVRGPALSTLQASAAAFSAEEVSRGEYLARAGNCAACHTAHGGQDFAGGLKMATPLGVIEATNITPDPETGIGAYSLQDFDLAMRQGVAPGRRYLYPAMPYPSYARISDADIRSLYAYFMTAVAPVKRANAPTSIPWPLNMRWPLAVWNTLFAPSEPYHDSPDASAAWNRGAYLVQGLGHCGACHTPRGIAQQERAYDEQGRLFLTGGQLDHWSAPDLGGNPRWGLGRWSEADIARFLKTGRNRFSSSFGTMTEVINSSTQYLSDADLTAIGVYLKALRPAAEATGTSTRLTAACAPISDSGATEYWRYCSSCHGAKGEGQGAHIAPLAGNPAIQDPDPSSVINITLNGSMPIVIGGLPDRYKMPPFRNVMDDRELAALLNYMRCSWGNEASLVRHDQIAKIRSATEYVRDQAQLLQMQ